MQYKESAQENTADGNNLVTRVTFSNMTQIKNKVKITICLQKKDGNIFPSSCKF